MADAEAKTLQDASGNVPSPRARPGSRPPPRSVPTMQTAVQIVPEPYGAARVEDTNQEQFRISMLQQMHDANLPLPKIYIPFPDKSDQEPATDMGTGSVVGEGPDISLKETLTAVCEDNPDSCDGLFASLKDKWRVFTALHETTHYVDAMHAGNRLSMDVASHLFGDDQRTRQDVEFYKKYTHTYGSHALAMLQEISKDPVAARNFADIVIMHSIPERIADASAALYMLSNYGDATQVKEFMQKFKELQQIKALDSDHNTASSIQAALDYYEAHKSEPKMKGLTIVQTAELAADIIKQQPDLDASPEERTQAVLDHEKSRMTPSNNNDAGHGSPPPQQSLTTPTTRPSAVMAPH